MSTPLSEERLAEIAAREQETRRGPWLLVDSNEGQGWPPRPFWCVGTFGDDEGAEEVEIHTGDKGVGEFIAHAREDVPDLLAEVARQRKVIMRLTDGANAGVQRVRMYQSESGAWRVRWMLDGRRKATTCGSEAEARDFAGRLQAESGAQ